MQLFKIIKFFLISLLFSPAFVHAQHKISINKIFNTYQSNVAKFDEKYKGKSVEIVAIFNRIIGLNESLNYKEASRKRWGYLSEFSMNSKKIICFSENSSDASYSEPNKIAYVQGNLSDIDDGKMIITNCYVGDPKYATINSNISAQELIENAMVCDEKYKRFSPEYIIKKLIEMKYIDPKNSVMGDEWQDISYKLIKPLYVYGLQVKEIAAYDHTAWYLLQEESIFPKVYQARTFLSLRFKSDKNLATLQERYTGRANNKERFGLHLSENGISCSILQQYFHILITEN